ncbi:unnamed protein product [Rotaria sordida]|uniref:Netrin-1 n=1 Tax=Rotaria sordida TaxID=392033 RepID=A0A814ZKF6_9BILA|nr:unnamed protein product [Rotaria sordida]CAF1208325.1 unnamed protein product [Rotaria sordida]CAF1244150.1 unnamed protein product [Rotaria sordida]CAF1463353.1 unnamed protein product [Rotaria sordida]
MFFIKLIFSFVLISLSLCSANRWYRMFNTYYDDPCIDHHKRFQRCIPDFINAAYQKPVYVSSTCGNSPKEFCNLSQLNKNHPIDYLTDINNPNNLTCWQSDLIKQGDNISLILSLKKKFELTYISLQFCSQNKPDSMAIFKSMDMGLTWIPLQYYSNNCEDIFNKSSNGIITRSNEQEALCIDTKSQLSTISSESRIAFSTLEGRPSAYEFDTSPVLQDWVTATDIKIILLSSSLSSSNIELNSYSVADFAVGGRCKCNGHASKCLTNSDGRLVCDCKHNTAGDECERCKDFHYDRPWARATQRDANECVVCNCNKHSTKCRFNLELYKMSGHKSGGVCLDCQHNTAGRSCHYCREGFTRDLTQSMTSINACQACNCHPVGSRGKICNQTTGQCPCKDGVTGLRCDRCMKGYQQTKSPISPCIKKLDLQSSNLYNIYNQDNNMHRYHEQDVDNDDDDVYTPPTKRTTITTTTTTSMTTVRPILTEYNPLIDMGQYCGACRYYSRRLHVKKYCKRDYTIHARVTNQHDAGQWISYLLTIVRVYKDRLNRIQESEQWVWVSRKDVQCSCPRLKLDKQYLLMGFYDQMQTSLSLDRTSVVIEWRPRMEQRMNRFRRYELNKKC